MGTMASGGSLAWAEGARGEYGERARRERPGAPLCRGGGGRDAPRKNKLRRIVRKVVIAP